MAARRDASVYRAPSGHGHAIRPSKVHAIVVRRDGTRGPACGIPFHVEQTEEPAVGVAEGRRCSAPGCRAAYRAALQEGGPDSARAPIQATAGGDALRELMATIAAGVACTQQAGDGPYVYAKGRARPFSSRTARRGERLGLLRLDWCTGIWAWRWSLTEKGRETLAKRDIPSGA